MISTTKLNELYKKIPKHYKQAFFYAIVFGIICHFYMMTNKLTNHDDIEQLYNKMDLSTSGRWFLQYAGSIGSYFSMPWVNGSLILFYLAISNALVVGLFEIKDRILIILLSGLTMSITTIVALFVFLNSADAYYLGYLLSILGGYLYIRNVKYGKAAFVILNVFSLAIYQIFFGISISIIFIYYIVEFIKGKSNISDTTRKCFKLAFFCLLTLIVYIVSIKYIFRIKLSTYKGINNMANIDIAYLPIAIGRAYSDIPLFFLGDRLSQFGFIKYLNYPLFAIFFAMYIFLVNKNLQDSRDKIFSGILLFLSPLAINFIYLASGDTMVDLRMLATYICIYMFIIILLKEIITEIEKYNANIRKKIVLFSWLIPMILLATIGRFYIVTNKAYMTLDIDSRNMASYTSRVIGRIEEKYFYNKKKEVVFVGLPDISNKFTDSYTTDDVYSITFFRRKIPSRWHWTLYPERYAAFPNPIRYYENVDYKRNPDKKLKDLIDKSEIFPRENSIFEYNNKIYVKYVNYK